MNSKVYFIGDAVLYMGPWAGLYVSTHVGKVVATSVSAYGYQTLTAEYPGGALLEAPADHWRPAPLAGELAN